VLCADSFAQSAHIAHLLRHSTSRGRARQLDADGALPALCHRIEEPYSLCGTHCPTWTQGPRAASRRGSSASPRRISDPATPKATPFPITPHRTLAPWVPISRHRLCSTPPLSKRSVGDIPVPAVASVTSTVHGVPNNLNYLVCTHGIQPCCINPVRTCCTIILPA
jgi:hypothetical protein